MLLSYLLLRGQNGQIPMKSLRFPSDTLLPSHPTAKRSFTFYSPTTHFCDLTYFSHGIVSPRNWSSRWCRHEPAQEFTSSLTAHREKRISYFRCFPTFFFFLAGERFIEINAYVETQRSEHMWNCSGVGGAWKARRPTGPSPRPLTFDSPRAGSIEPSWWIPVAHILIIHLYNMERG